MLTVDRGLLNPTHGPLGVTVPTKIHVPYRNIVKIAVITAALTKSVPHAPTNGTTK